MKITSHILSFLVSGLFLFHLTGCGKHSLSTTEDPNSPMTSGALSRSEWAHILNNMSPKSAQFPIYSYEVIHVWPHLRQAFTQGLTFHDGELLESTGLNGQSSLRKVDLETGHILKLVNVPSPYFAEGLAVLNGKVFQLTWQNQKGFIYDLKSFQLEREFVYEGEGWGLTTNGHQLIMSDGTSQIRFLDPNTLSEIRKITVSAYDQPINRLNELEFIKGEIYANVLRTNYVLRIDPVTGKVVGIIDFTGLLTEEDRSPTGSSILNGIAYDATTERLFVTGKEWSKLFEVSLKLKQ